MFHFFENDMAGCFGFRTPFMDMIISHNKNDFRDFHEWTPSENMTDSDYLTGSFSWCNDITLALDWN